jgi:hypothetical protein
MIRPRVIVTWLLLSAMIAVSGLAGVERAMGIPTYQSCTGMTGCPTCIAYQVGVMEFGCAISSGQSYPVCEPSYSGTCGEFTSYSCKGYENSKPDCSGTTDFEVPCKGSVYGCP